MGYIFLRFLNVFITNLISCLGIRILYKHNTFNNVFYWKQTIIYSYCHSPYILWAPTGGSAVGCGRDTKMDHLVLSLKQLLISQGRWQVHSTAWYMLRWGGEQWARLWENRGRTASLAYESQKSSDRAGDRLAGSSRMSGIWSLGNWVIFSLEKGSRICKSLVESSSLPRSL